MAHKKKLCNLLEELSTAVVEYGDARYGELKDKRTNQETVDMINNEIQGFINNHWFEKYRNVEAHEEHMKKNFAEEHNKTAKRAYKPHR